MIKVATSTSYVTPQQPCFMGGYGMRRQKSEGVLDELKCTAILLEINDETVVMCDVEILMITPEIVTAVKEQLEREFGVYPERVTIATTHTHAGPEMDLSVYRVHEKPMMASGGTYQDFLKEDLRHHCDC